jgi:hypothetical protein
LPNFCIGELPLNSANVSSDQRRPVSQRVVVIVDPRESAAIPGVEEGAQERKSEPPIEQPVIRLVAVSQQTSVASLLACGPVSFI